MENRHIIEQELREIGSSVAALGAMNPYRVPAGYFEALPAEVLARAAQSDLFANASGEVYRVPSGYFEGLAARVLERIGTDAGTNEVRAELETVAPLLNSIGREPVYSVPAGYFDTLDLAAKAMQPAGGRVISLRTARRWMQYVAAAMMAGILVMGAFMFTGDKANLSIEKDAVSSGFNQVSEGELEKYLDNPEHFVAAPAATSLASDAELADVRSDIHDISDEELNQYLKENAENFETPSAVKE